MRLRSHATPVGRWDVVALVVGLCVLVVTCVAATAELSVVETRVFRAVNDLPEGVYPFVWPLMQYGTFITIPLIALVALAFRRYRAAIAIAASGVAVYLIARVVKAAVERGRPGALLAEVHAREVFGEGSLGFPSGHAAVAAALAFTCGMYFGGWTLLVGLALAVVVPIGRLYVGAHLPLDVVGGAALGIVAGSIAHMLIGVPEETPDPTAERSAGNDDSLAAS